MQPAPPHTAASCSSSCRRRRLAAQRARARSHAPRAARLWSVQSPRIGALRAAASPRLAALPSLRQPRRCAAFIVRPAAAAAPAAAPAAGWQRHLPSRGRRGQLQPRATPTVHDPPSPSPLPRLSRRPSAAPVPPPPTHGCAAAAAQSAAGRGGCPRRLCGSRAGRAELGRGVGRPQAARAQRLHRQRPRHGHGPARRRLGRHGAAGRRRAVQETPQLGAGLPPSRCPPRPVRPTP